MEEIEAIAEELERENDKRAASDPLVKNALQIVEEFLKTHPVLCYGGTAINNLLPPKERFYDPVYDIPDYDFFSRTPQEHAMVLSNKLRDAGVKNIEVKPGVHLGTFKVFADFEGVADITDLEEPIFEKLWKANIVKEGIHYVTPDFLRMSMYLELSRPRGDVSRWVKIYKRLQLLNKHYPIVCKKETAKEHSSATDKEKREVKRLLKSGEYVLLGFTAAEIHLQKREWTLPVAMLGNKATIEEYVKGKTYEFDEGTEILPPMYSVKDEEGRTFLKLYETTACHSFHAMDDGTRVASIPTILQFFFAYLYSDAEEGNIASTLCTAERLLEIAHSKPKRRFALLTPKDCLGKQETLVDLRKNKATLYETLSKNKSSPEFLQYFFTYNPNAPKTERAKIRERLRKTRKARNETV
jgi:hypothetical protein